MRKRYLSVLITVIVFVIAFYYLSLPTSPPNILNQLQSQGNQTQENRSFFNFPFIPGQSNKEPSSGGGSGGGSGGSSSGGSKGGSSGQTNQTNTPKIYYTLNIDSGFGSTDIITAYYENDTSYNITKKTPYSIDIEANTEACVAAASSYTGYFWAVDQSSCDMINCGDYPSGCKITMDKPHNVTIFQNS